MYYCIPTINLPDTICLITDVNRKTKLYVNHGNPPIISTVGYRSVKLEQHGVIPDVPSLFAILNVSYKFL